MKLTYVIIIYSDRFIIENGVLRPYSSFTRAIKKVVLHYDLTGEKSSAE